MEERKARVNATLDLLDRIIHLNSDALDDLIEELSDLQLSTTAEHEEIKQILLEIIYPDLVPNMPASEIEILE